VSGLRIGILDDYQDVARSFADWDSLSAQIEVFTAPFSDADEVVQRLAGFDVLVAMRERTSFPGDVLSRQNSESSASWSVELATTHSRAPSSPGR
jgi:hypothetical protein